MKLLYIWNGDYGTKNLHNKEFMLNSEYHIVYNSCNNLLTINKNDEYISGFWGGNISDCFAVIGENGVGKTMLMNLLMQICVELKTKHSVRNEYFVIFYDNGNSKIYTFYSGRNPEINLKGIERSCYESYEIDTNTSELFNNFHVAYFHNALNRADYIAKNRCEYDFSISRKIANDAEVRNEMHHAGLSEDKILNYFSNEAFKIIYFLYNYAIGNPSKIPFPIPQKVQIGITEYNTNYLVEKAKRLENENNRGNLIKVISQYCDDLGMYARKIDSLWIGNTIKQLLMNCFTGILFPSVPTSRNVGSKIEKGQILYGMANRLCKEYDGHIDGKEACKITLRELRNLKDLVEKHEEYIIKNTIDFISWMEKKEIDIKSFENKCLPMIEVKTGKQSKRFINEMVELYSKVSLVFPFYEFSFDVSAGEYLFLSIFADLYYMRENIVRFNSSECKKYILLIFDEAELSMHPRWQREYINWIVEFCGRCFDRQQIQIIVTTHSPILLSDFPAKNVLYFKNKNGTINVKYDYIKTFGNNIHTLYLNSFFLDDQGIVGSFAEKKINGIVEELLEDEICKNWDRDKLYRIQTMIDFIGEEIVRTRLLELYHQKTGERLGKNGNRRYIGSEAIKDTISILKAQKEQLEVMISKLERQYD